MRREAAQGLTSSFFVRGLGSALQGEYYNRYGFFGVIMKREERPEGMKALTFLCEIWEVLMEKEVEKIGCVGISAGARKTAEGHGCNAEFCLV